MNIRDSLSIHFDIDVLIESGLGSECSPYIISRCSADQATKTQLDLLRGLGKGRKELWRLTQAEMSPFFDGTIQVIDIDTISFTLDEAITEVRSFYFDISRVNGKPHPDKPNMAWHDHRTTFSAPYQIGWLHFERVINNSKSGHIDTTLFYSSIDAKAAIYVYDIQGRALSEESITDLRMYELDVVCNQVQRLSPEAKAPWPIRVAEPFALQAFLIEGNISFVGIAIIGGNFLKLRLTFDDTPDMRDLMGESLNELRKLVNAAMELVS